MKVDLLLRYFIQGQVKDIEIWAIKLEEKKKKAMRLQIIHSISELKMRQIRYFCNIKKENLYFKPVSDLQAVLFLDDVPEENLERLPSNTIIVRTSDHKYQAHIFLQKARPLEARTKLQKLLQEHFGSDPGSTDGNHARRLPNTLNWKYPEHPVVRVIKEVKGGKTPEQLIAELEREQRKEQEKQEQEKLREAKIKSNDAKKDWWYFYELKKDENGKADLSRVDFAYTVYLYKRGLSKKEIERRLEMESENIQERKKGHLEDYLDRTYRKALIFVKKWEKGG
jgi:superfamily II DNA helicase RecQ